MMYTERYIERHIDGYENIYPLDKQVSNSLISPFITLHLVPQLAYIRIYKPAYRQVNSSYLNLAVKPLANIYESKLAPHHFF